MEIKQGMKHLTIHVTEVSLPVSVHNPSDVLYANLIGLQSAKVTLTAVELAGFEVMIL